jgi:hypothetical protein
MSKPAWIAAATLGLCACASVDQSEFYQSWVGHNIGELIPRQGIPGRGTPERGNNYCDESKRQVSQ